MKKLVLVLSLLAGVSRASSQSNIHPGFKAGVNLSSWVAEVPGIDIYTGFYAGAMLRVPVSKSVSLLPELLFSNEGTKTPSGKYVDNFIKIPFIAQYTHASGFHFETGPQLALLLTSKYKEQGEKSDTKGYRKPTELSWGTGFGYTLPAGMGLNLRYNIGLTKIGTDEISVKSNVLAAGLHYMF